MSDTEAARLLGREDVGDVTVMRPTVPMLRSDETTELLFRQLHAVVDEAGRSRLVLNFDEVVFISSMVIGKLVMLLHKVRRAGGRLAVCKLGRTIFELMQMTHLDEVVPIYGDQQEAVRSFA
jgi:anti-sigma B factor antagonist